MIPGCFIDMDQKGISACRGKERDRMYETVLKIKRNIDGDMIISIDDHDAWRVSEDLKILMLKDIKKNLGGEFDSLALRLLKKIICI